MEHYKSGEIIFCIDETPYSTHLTKRKEYKVLELGTGTKEGKILIKGDADRQVWITELCFSRTNQPMIKQIIIDDEISNPTKDCIETTIVFSDETKGWLSFTTPEQIKEMLQSNQMYFDQHSIVVLKITPEIINDTIQVLDKSNKLIDVLIPYK